MISSTNVVIDFYNQKMEKEIDFVKPIYLSIEDIQNEILQDVPSEKPKNVDLEKQKQEQKLQRYRELAAKRNKRQNQQDSPENKQKHKIETAKKSEDVTKHQNKSVPEFEHVEVKLEEDVAETMEIEIEPSQLFDYEDESTYRKTLATPVLPTVKFKCSQCPYWTQRKNVLEIHKKIHTENKVRSVTLLSCARCKFKTIYSKEMRRHEARYHKRVLTRGRKVSEGIECDKCSYKAISKNDIFLHKSAEHNDESILLKCLHCSFKTEHRKSLKSHLLCHKNLVDRTRFSCDICLFESKSTQGLSRHKRTHKQPYILGAPEIFACEECNFTSIHKTSVQYHKMTHQKDEEILLYKCDQCPHQTKFKWGLNAHKKTHLKAEERPVYACQECEYETFYKGNLKSHYEVVHRGKRVSRKTQCEQCGFVTRYKKKMREHTRLMHDLETALQIKTEELLIQDTSEG